MDLQRMSNEELEYELNDVNQKLSEMIVSKRKGCFFPQKKFNSYLNYKRAILKEIKRRAK